jgi:hypothetical protein
MGDIALDIGTGHGSARSPPTTRKIGKLLAPRSVFSPRTPLESRALAYAACFLGRSFIARPFLRALCFELLDCVCNGDGAEVVEL